MFLLIQYWCVQRIKNPGFFCSVEENLTIREGRDVYKTFVKLPILFYKHFYCNCFPLINKTVKNEIGKRGNFKI